MAAAITVVLKYFFIETFPFVGVALLPAVLRNKTSIEPAWHGPGDFAPEPPPCRIIV
jgi:hypothetical protein